MWRQVQDLGQHDAVEALAGDRHFFDSQAKRTQRLAELHRITLDIWREFTQPGEQHFHREPRNRSVAALWLLCGLVWAREPHAASGDKNVGLHTDRVSEWANI